MLGLINKAIENFAIDTYGKRFWNSFTRRHLNGEFTFEPLLEYEHALTFRLIDWLAEARSKTSADIMEDIGTFLVSQRNGEALRRLLRFGGANFVEFIFSLDELNERSEIALKDLNLPQLSVERINQNSVSVRVDQSWPGFEHVMAGILRSLADDYGALVFINVLPPEGSSAYLVLELIQHHFTEGRKFSLA